MPDPATPKRKRKLSPDDYTPVSKPSLLTLGAIITIGALLRFYQLESRGMYDEASSWIYAQMPWLSFWKVMWGSQGNMVLYYLLLGWWLYLGDSEWTMRSLSVLFGLATIPAVYLMGSRFFGRQAGLIAGALLAVHALHIQLSQHARSYALLTLLLVVSTYLFARWVESPHHKGLWWGYVAVSALAHYSHSLAVLVLAAQWLSLGTALLRRLGIPMIAQTVGAVALASAPMTAFSLFQYKGQVDWVQPLTFKRFLAVLSGFAGNGGGALMVVWLALIAIALWHVNRSDGNRAEEKWRVRLLLCWLLVPIAALILISLFKPLFIGRFLLMSVPALVLLAGVGIQGLSRHGLRSRWAAALVLLVALGLSGYGDYKHIQRTHSGYNSFRAWTQHILTHQQPGDAAFFFPPAAHKQFNYYSNREPSDRRTLRPTTVFPPFFKSPTGDPPPDPTKEEVRAAVHAYERVWLISRAKSDREQSRMLQIIRSTIEEEFALEREDKFTGESNFVVILYAKRR